MKPSTDYAATLERDVSDPDWLGPYGFARNLRWGPFGVAKAATAHAVQIRAVPRSRPRVVLSKFTHENRDGALYFPGTQVEPIRERVGSRVVIETVTIQSTSGRAYGVLWRCDCGRTGRMDVSPWRRATSTECMRCARKSKKAAYNAPPRESSRERAEREAEAMRRNPLRVA